MKKKYNLQSLIVINMMLIIYILINYFIYTLSVRRGGTGIGFQFFGGGNDGELYYNHINLILEGLTPKVTSIYPYVMAGILFVFQSNNAFLIKFVNLIVLVLYIYKSFQIYICISNGQKNSFFLLFGFLYVSMWANSFQSIYRDPWIYYLFAAAIYEFLCFSKSDFRKMSSLFLFLIHVAIIYFFRPYASFSILITGFVITISYALNIRVKSIIVLFLFVILGVYLYIPDYVFLIVNKSLRDALSYRNFFVVDYSGGSQMGLFFPESNLIQFLQSYMTSFLNHMLGPFPRYINSISIFIIFLLESLPLLFMHAYIFLNRKMLTQNHIDLYLFGFVWIVLISFSNDNIGAMTRLRVPYVVIVYTLFLSLKGENNEKSIVCGDSFKKAH